VEIATGAMVPEGTDAIVRVEDSRREDGLVSGEPRAVREWREPGEEASRGEELLPAGTPVTPGVLGLAASCGYDTLRVHPPPATALLVFGDELLTRGAPGAGRVRDALGPSVPAWLYRLGATRPQPVGPVRDTLDAHVDAIRAALDAGARLVCTTGGTMHGPVDHLHPALAELGAEYIANTVAVRPGFPMLLARLPGGQFLAGLPGNPQSAVVALVTLVAPLLAGLTGRPLPPMSTVTLGAPIPGRGGHTHLALVRDDPADGRVYPLPHAGSSMLRGLARAVGFAVVPPDDEGLPGARLPLVPLPLLPGERP
jgi:molybdopterin molybdotransferase